MVGGILFVIVMCVGLWVAGKSGFVRWAFESPGRQRVLRAAKSQVTAQEVVGSVQDLCALRIMMHDLQAVRRDRAKPTIGVSLEQLIVNRSVELGGELWVADVAPCSFTSCSGEMKSTQPIGLFVCDRCDYAFVDCSYRCREINLRELGLETNYATHVTHCRGCDGNSFVQQKAAVEDVVETCNRCGSLSGPREALCDVLGVLPITSVKSNTSPLDGLLAIFNHL